MVSGGHFERKFGVRAVLGGKYTFSISSPPAPATIIREDLRLSGVFFFLRRVYRPVRLAKEKTPILRSNPHFSGRGFKAGEPFWSWVHHGARSSSSIVVTASSMLSSLYCPGI